MTDQEFVKALKHMDRQLKSINEKLEGLNQVEPWTKWFAWYPVYTVSNQRIWLKQIYKRKNGLILNLADYEYATDFDLLKDAE